MEILGKQSKTSEEAQKRLGDALHELADAVYFQGDSDAAAMKMQRDVVKLLSKRNEADELDAADLLTSMATAQVWQIHGRKW